MLIYYVIKNCKNFSQLQRTIKHSFLLYRQPPFFLVNYTVAEGEEMAEYDLITEFRLYKQAKDFVIFIYDLPVTDLDTKHSENGGLVYRLKKQNNNRVISFNENLVGAFCEIDWGKEKVNASKEERSINLSNERERTLLERLLKTQIISAADKSCYKSVRDTFLKSNKPVWSNGRAELYEKTDLSVAVDEEGNIVINVDITHKAESKIPLSEEITKGSIKEGDEVKDLFHDCYYKYIGVAPFTIAEPNEYMRGRSIVEYYAQKGEGYVTANLSLNTKAVLVKSKKGEPLPYIPLRLCRVLRLEDLKGAADSVIKMSADKKIQKIIAAAISLTWTSKITRTTDNWEQHIILIKSALLCRKSGYNVIDLKKPVLCFGSDHSCNYGYGDIIRSINNFGPYKNKENVEVYYYVDNSIFCEGNNVIQEKQNKVAALIGEIESWARQGGVTLKRMSATKEMRNAGYVNVDMENDTSFEIALREAMAKKIFDSPTVFFMSHNHLEKHYSTIKKVLSGRGGVTTQCVDFDRLERTSGRGRDSYLTNILLGVYAKSNIQAWALGKPLNSDCFVGLDVSRENGVNKSAFVQVIGKDGGVISSKVFATSQKGEVITNETIREILLDAVSAFTSRYGEKPKHVTFHRDGRCFENLDSLAKIAKEVGVEFDYVEITKDTHRRMATYSGTRENGRWQTVMGRCYKKDNYAYLCLTNPSERVGMAQPIRVTAKTNTLNFDKIIEDVWNLSFMHVHSLAKTRLPITTHYADLCSTFGIRDWLFSDNGSLLFFV